MMSVIVGANWRCGTLGQVNTINRVICGWWLPCGTLTIRKSDTRKTPKKGNEKSPYQYMRGARSHREPTFGRIRGREPY